MADDAPNARKRAVPAARPKRSAAAAKPAAPASPSRRAAAEEEEPVAPKATPTRARRTVEPRAPARTRRPQTAYAEPPTPVVTPARARRVAAFLDDEPEVPNYALRLTDGLQPGAPPEEDTFALRLNKALEAITAAQGPTVEELHPEKSKPGVGGFLAALDKLPPIKLPIGPAIPWRLGLPLLVALVVVMGVMSRSAGSTDSQISQLPAQQPTEAPLFAKPQPTAEAAMQDPAAAQPTVEPATQDQPEAQPTPAPLGQPSPTQQPIGVQDPGGMNFDFMDIAIKLVAVLALAYGSLLVLKKIGVGSGGAATSAGGSSHNVRVISSVALAPNRSIHVIRVPGGKTLLIGATPNAVNLLADLGDLADDETPEAASFLDALKGKLHQDRTVS